VLNSLQFSMLLFLLAIGLSVIFGLMDYLNLSHGTIYMFAAYVAFSITQLGGSFWAALALAPLRLRCGRRPAYFVAAQARRARGHLTQVLLTVGVIYMGTDLFASSTAICPTACRSRRARPARRSVRHPLSGLSAVHHRASASS
jgi:branched-chain amino acid transport system permease protein